MISDFLKAKPKLGTGARFKQLTGKLKRKGVDDPKALAAYIGRKKFGKKKFAALGKAKKTDENYPSSIKADAKFWDKKADRSMRADHAAAKHGSLAQKTAGCKDCDNKTVKSVFGMAKFDKSVPAGTRPFARRALPKEQIKQVRAKAPRYGMSKGVVAPCDNCGAAPVSGGVPLCANCAATMEKSEKSVVRNRCKCGHMETPRHGINGDRECAACDCKGFAQEARGDRDDLEKARKRKPSMVDHIMRMEGGEASEDEADHAMQQLVNSGDAWRLQGSYGRSAMDGIKSGRIALGHVGHRDYYGNYVPSRHEVQEGTKGHASFVRAAGYEPDKCGKDCPSPEVPDKLPQSIRNKKIIKADPRPRLIADLSQPLSKTYIKVDVDKAEGFLVKGAEGSSVKDGFGAPTTKTKGVNTVEECGDCGFAGTGGHKCPKPNSSRMKKSDYPQSGCPKCGHKAGALGLILHMRTKHPLATRIMANQSRQQTIQKSMEFKLLDENDPEYHGHTGGGAGYAGTKWVHMHGPTNMIANGVFSERSPKETHKHFKMGAFTTHHSPSGYREDILGGVGENEMDARCSLPNCGHPSSQHTLTDAGAPGCTGCNDQRPRRNVRHDFRS